jgi:putative transposase
VPLLAGQASGTSPAGLRPNAASEHPSQPPSLKALRRPPESTQYTSLAFGQRCEQLGVRPSTGSVGDAYDNAMAEAFFATLECELLQRRRLASQPEARMVVFHFIEGFYNPSRRHSALGYLSPINFERSNMPKTD